MPLTIDRVYETLQLEEGARVKQNLRRADSVTRMCTKFSASDVNNINSIDGVWISTTDNRDNNALLSTIMVGVHDAVIIAETEIGKRDAESYIKSIEHKSIATSSGRLKSFIQEFKLIVKKGS
jgi:hypothetical protein